MTPTVSTSPAEHSYFTDTFHSAPASASGAVAGSDKSTQDALLPTEGTATLLAAGTSIKTGRTLSATLQKRQLTDMVQALQTCVINTSAELHHNDEKAVLRLPSGMTFSVGGQRDPDQPHLFYARIPGTDEFLNFPVHRGPMNVNAGFEWLLTGTAVIAEADTSLPEDLAALLIQDPASEEHTYLEGQQLQELRSAEVKPASDVSSRADASAFKLKGGDFPDERLRKKVESHRRGEDNPDLRTNLAMVKKIRRGPALGGVTARAPSRTPSETLDNAEDTASSDDDFPFFFSRRKQERAYWNDLDRPDAQSHQNPRITTRVRQSQGDNVLLSFLDEQSRYSATRAAAGRNPIENLPGSFQLLNRKLISQDAIHIAFAGCGHTAIGTALYWLFDEKGERKYRQDLDAAAGPRIKLTFVDPAGVPGGLAYQPGKGCLGGSAAAATRTNTPAAHLEFHVAGFQFADFLAQKLERLKADKAAHPERSPSSIRYDVFGRRKAPELAAGLTHLLRQHRQPDDIERIEKMLAANYAEIPQRSRFFRYHEDSGKSKANTRRDWIGQATREEVGEYDCWVIDKLRKSGIDVDIVKGEVTACESDAELNANLSYTQQGAAGVEKKSIRPDLAVLATGQGPLKLPGQMAGLSENRRTGYDSLIQDAGNLIEAIDRRAADAPEKIRAYTEKWLGHKKILVLGMGIAAEEVQPVVNATFAAIKAYQEKNRIPGYVSPAQPPEIFYGARGGYNHELKREDTFMLRYGFPDGAGKHAFNLEKITTEKERDYRARITAMLREGQTSDVGAEVAAIIQEIEVTPDLSPKAKALLDASLAFAIAKTGNAVAAGEDDSLPEDGSHGWRDDIAACLMRLNIRFNTFLEKSAVPTRNENVDRFSMLREEGYLLKLGRDYQLAVGADGKVELAYQDQTLDGIGMVVNCTGRENYGLQNAGKQMRLPEMKKIGDPADPALQSFDVEQGFFGTNAKGEVLPLVLLNPSWISWQVLTGSRSLHGTKGALAAFGVSAKVSLGRAQEAGTVGGSLIFRDMSDPDHAPLRIRADPEDTDEIVTELSKEEFHQLVDDMKA